jgi:hypothetical protein
MTFDMVGRIDECVLLSYAVDPSRATEAVPRGLDVTTYRGYAFLNIVVCHIDRMRPRFAPSTLGMSYWHVAYRLHVRAPLESGGSIDGLYFLRSDVNSPAMSAIGNRMTDFRFHGAAMRVETACDRWSVTVASDDERGSATLRVTFACGDDRLTSSPFSSIEDRERLLKYAPFGLSVSETGAHVRVAEVIRDESLWTEQPVAVESADWTYPGSLGLGTDRLVRATRVEPIDYIWRIGRQEVLCYRPGLNRKEGTCPPPSPRRTI